MIIPAVMMPITMAPIVMMVIADMHADAADMQANAHGISGSSRRAQKTQGENGGNDFFHQSSF
jgi:hypothetical protein